MPSSSLVPARRFTAKDYHEANARLTSLPVSQTEQRYSFDSWLMDSMDPFGALRRPTMSWSADPKVEGPGGNYDGYAQGGYQSNGIVFAVLNARMRLFTEARFQWQRITNGRPGDLFGTPELSILERPWMNGTTGDLLARMEQHASLGGNAYPLIVDGASGPELRLPRPDWVEIVMGGDPEQLDCVFLGIKYHPKGPNGGARPVTYLAPSVAHYAPIPDPMVRYRGMSWLQPIVEEIRADSAATVHKGKFFDNAATPNMVISMKEAMKKDDLVDFATEMRKHEGGANAYKTLWLANGADAKVVGADLKQLDFKVTQGAGETRIAAAGGVPPLIVGLSEGLGAATYSNYAQARRAFADLWARPSWRQAAGALETLVGSPGGDSSQVRLWYDDRDIPFLQEDEKDDSSIAAERANTIRTLTDAGYTPASVVDAVGANDFSRLIHSGLYSVQLQAPGAMSAPPVPA